jgi:hypothetical protein
MNSLSPHHRRLPLLLLAGLLLIALTPAAPAQVSFTAVQPADAGFGPLDKSAPSTPPDQIVQKFAAKESQYRRALDNYTYTRSVKIQTIDDDGKVDGEYQQVTDISYGPDHAKLEHVTFAPQNSLQRIIMTPADMSDIEQRLPFVLTTEDLPQYNLTYVGRQKVDELQTYVFDVVPKTIEKNHRYLQGRIWVDQQDLQIVLVSGKNVPDDLRKGHEDLSLPFVTWREQVDGQYWFPVYTKSDGVLHFSGGKGYMAEDVHVRNIVRYTDYKRFKSDVKITFEGQDISNNGQQPQSQPQPAPPPK